MTLISASMRGDATAAVERVAGWLRSEGAPHPGAGALALAARGHAGLGQFEFAQAVGLPPDEVRALERGEVSFGELPAELDRFLAAISGLDLLAVSDIERQWRRDDRDDPMAG